MERWIDLLDDIWAFLWTLFEFLTRLIAAVVVLGALGTMSWYTLIGVSTLVRWIATRIGG